MKANSNKTKIKIDISSVLNVFLPLLIFVTLEFYFILPDLYIYCFQTFIFSLFIVYSIFFVLLSIIKNTKYVNLVMTIIGFLIIFISKIKYLYMSEPLFVSDVYYIKDFGESLSYTESNLSSSILSILPLTIFVVLVLIILNILSFKYNKKINSKKIRICGLVVPAIIFTIIFFPNRQINEFIKNNIYPYPYTRPMEFYLKYGHLGGMYGTICFNRVYPKDDYDEKEIDNLVNSSSSTQDHSLGKPDIIVVFSESYWNIDKIDEVEFDKKMSSNIESLKSEGLYYNMLSPSYGGVSSNVEFEFMTGFTLDYYGNGYIPYMHAYNNDSYYDKPNIIKELKNNNYYTKITSYGGKDLYSAQDVYRYFKVDKTEFENDIKLSDSDKKGGYASDHYSTDKIIEELEKDHDGKNLFYLMMTMQNHMPYGIKKYDKYDIEVVNSSIEKDKTNVIQSYAQGVYDADIELKRLYDYIKEREKDTIIIFFGDHLPILLESYTATNNILLDLKYFNTDNQLLSLYRMYNTEALVLANFDISSLKEENENIKYLSPDLLSTYLLNHMDINLSNYYKWLYNTIDIIPSSNMFVSIDKNGKMYYTSKLEGNMKKLYDIRENIQYKYFVK